MSQSDSVAEKVALACDTLMHLNCGAVPDI
jgi:hypothetical protein